MACANQVITDQYAMYEGDCIEVMADLPAESVHLSVYSPPFAGLFNYTSSERDLSNSRTYSEFLEHYEHVVRQVHRLTMPGRITAVHCMDVPDRTGRPGAMLDFPGDIIRLHQAVGFDHVARYHIWKPPLEVRNRTLVDGLAHQTVVEDSTRSAVAAADYLLTFRREGDNPVPVVHPQGFLEYAGSTPIPAELARYRGWAGKQTENRFSQWIWRRYASACWGDIRGDRVLPYRETRDAEDERHIHPLPLDIADRCVALWSNPGETVLSPFAGIGTEPYAAVMAGRRGLGIELKGSYYRPSLRNLAAAAAPRATQTTLLEIS